MGKTFARRDLDAHPRVSVSGIPPVMPYAGLDHCHLALAQEADLPVALHGQLALEHGEAFNKGRMIMLANHARANEGGEFRSRAAFLVLSRKLEDRCSLAVMGFSHTSPIWMGLKSGGPFGSG